MDVVQLYDVPVPWSTLEVFHGACVLKSSGEIIGFTGLNPYLPKQPELEWQFGVPHWGKGYATEAVRYALTWAEENLHAPEASCIIDPENLASLNVAAKVGFREKARTTYHDDPTIVFSRPLR